VSIDGGKDPLDQENSLINEADSQPLVSSTAPKAKDYDKLSKALRHNLIKRKSQQRLREAPQED
jgi:hypothetical protein